jgi:glycosyltransferase involved in cell wall biosynthesis
MTLRVGMNLLWLVPGEAGGAERYATRLLGALSEAPDDDVEITIFCTRRFPRAYPELAGRFATTVAPLDGRSRPVRIAFESSWLVREARRRRLEVIHHMNDVLPWVGSCPAALTIHDLRSMAGTAVLGHAHAAYLRARIPTSVRRAAVVMTPTAYVREQVLDILDGDPARTLVVSAPLLGHASDRASPADGSFVYPAKTSRHKNHLTLLEAFAKLVAAEPDARLVLTGPAGDADGDVAATIRRLGLTDTVRRAGRVPEAELDRLLGSAVALVYPSRFEGYGLPIAEAMSMGCPVIAADATALPEVVGDAGLLVDPTDVDAWTDAMARVLHDDALRAELARAGRERVRDLTPAAAVHGLHEAYRIAAS